jgi:hypothetical protein
VSNGTNRLSLVHELRDAWCSYDERRALGGIHALRGFDYQFCLFLKALLLRWKITPPDKRLAEPGVYTEAVSDILAIPMTGPVYVTQVKLSLSPSSLNDTLEEFAAISKAVSGIAADIHFGICASIIPTWDVHKKITQWASKQGFSELESHAFAHRIEILTDSDPFDDCLGILANDLGDRNAVAHLNEFIGCLLHGVESTDLKPVATQIWGKLVEIARNQEAGPSGVYVWASTDRPPSAVSVGDTLIGQQPRPFHLRDGYFAPRQPLYDDLVRTVGDWLHESRAQRDPSVRVPVFWIRGRSGSGKSVALLHVLAGIHALEDSHVMWLGDNTSLLPDALAWAAGLSHEGRQSIIGIDDPYAPLKRNDMNLWTDALRHLEPIRNKGATTPLPAILCCGPTEHAERFAQDFVSGVKLETEDLLPYETSSDLAQLRGWYRERTQHDAPDVGDENVLLVQLFFQWRAGVALEQFSMRFRDRIIESGGEELREAISCMLCANRLYVGYPTAALTDRLSPGRRDMLDRLLLEHHITRMSEGRTGFWLTHPHLANVIYENWHPAEIQEESRRSHLLRVIDDTLKFGCTPQERTAPLWAISRSAERDPEEPTTGRLNAVTVANVIPQVYESRISGKECMPLSEIPAWIQIRATFPDLPWKPDPIDIAIGRVDPRNLHQTGLRLTCHKLFEHFDVMSEEQRQRTCATINAFLEHTQDWFEWQNVCLDAYRCAPNRKLGALIVTWIRGRAQKTHAQYLLLNLLHTQNIAPAVADLAAEILVSAHDSTRVLSDIAVRLSESAPSPGSTEAIRQWTAKNYRERHAGFLLAQLVRKNDLQALTWAYEWVTLWRTHHSANWLLEALCDAGHKEPVLRDHCIAWIEAGHAEANPGYLLEKALRTFPGDSAIERVAFDWSEKMGASDGTWLFVFVALMSTTRDRRRLISLGMDALAVAWPTHRLWRPIWDELWHATRGNPRLLDIGVAALRRMPYHKTAWVETWNLLWHVTNGADILIEVGADWLDTCVKSRAWGGMWGRLWGLRQGDRRLKAIASKWLGSNLRTWNVWFAVWQKIWQTDKTDQMTLELAAKWLCHAPFELPSWIVVWEILWHQDKGSPELKQKAMQWLAGADPNKANWEQIWSFVWEADKNDRAVCVIGRKWIEIAPLDHGSWSRVWRALWTLDQNDESLRTCGMTWVMDPGSFMHGDWQRVWKELLKCAPQDQALLDLGRKWLRQISVRNNWWPNVWTALYTDCPGDRDLLIAACNWLQNTSPTRNQWCNIWKEVRHANVATTSLCSTVMEQVRTNFDHPDWFYLWDSTRKTCEGNSDMTALAKKWLDDMTMKKPNHGSWGMVWKALWEDESQRSHLRAAATKWFECVSMTQTTWPPVWNMLRESTPGDATILEVGRRLLRRTPDYHLGWYQVWRPILDVDETDEDILAMGREWLRTTPIQQVDWSAAWLVLYGLGQWPTELLDRAIAWLELTATGKNLNGWQTVWAVLWDANYARDRLTATASRWIDTSPKFVDTTPILSRLDIGHRGKPLD